MRAFAQRTSAVAPNGSFAEPDIGSGPPNGTSFSSREAALLSANGSNSAFEYWLRE
jgi:hypothetical protein